MLRIVTAILSCCLMLSACSILPGKKTETGRAPSKNPCIVLALPGTGPYAGIASKIRKGAQISQQQLARQGINARIENINTESPNWLSQLAALPEECAVVGGPMREQSYLAAEKAGALERRAFFAFMPNLQAGDEGKRAWRFFPGPQDQIDALVNFTTKDLNIHKFGAFYPSDSYGERMTRLLEETLASKGLTLEKAAYNPHATSGWNVPAESLVHPLKSPGRSPVPQTAFEAVLLPDSWKNIDRLTSSFIMNGEDRLVLMGTTLWEQSLSGKQIPKAERYELAIFPGAWDAARAPKALQGGGNDFWSALGYDFIVFAAHIGMAERLASSAVTAAARTASSSMKAMAPITYDGNGRARQKLYLFQVSPAGMVPLNPGEFKEKRQRARQNTAARIQTILSEPAHVTPTGLEEEAGSQAENLPARVEHDAETPRIQRATHEGRETRSAPAYIPPAAPQAPAPSQTPLSTVPDPSYKLRLPTKK